MPTAFGAVAGGVTKSPAGLLLAAGAGHRMGTPKALVGDWLTRGVDVLTAAGCSPVVVVRGPPITGGPGTRLFWAEPTGRGFWARWARGGPTWSAWSGCALPG
jgi:hypothetical protein